MNVQTQALIVGAGPTGLSLACQLLRYGISFQIIDLREGVTPFSKALGVQARTLEIYDQLGLVHKAIEQGNVAGRVRMLSGGQVRGELDLSRIGEGQSEFPFVLLLEQSKNEQLLYDYVRSHGKDVHWQTELLDFAQDSEGVTARLRSAEGAERTVRARYLAGCDGAKSAVRHQLGLGFEGSTNARTYYVLDAQVDGPLVHDAVQPCFSRDAFLLFFPLKGERRFRIVGVFPEEVTAESGELLYEEIEADIRKQSHLPLEVRDVEWFSTYRVHTRHAGAFSSGRCFLAGDAAHIHSPAGAQGMNTGIQDAYNLAWKLGFVLRHRASDSLLDTYNEERLENAKRLLVTTDRLFEFGAGTEWFQAFFREHVFPVFANTVLNLEAVKHVVFPLISQIGINYRSSSLSDHRGDPPFKAKAGDRLPYYLIDGDSIYHHLREPKFHLLSFGDAGPSLGTVWDEWVERRVFPIQQPVVEAFGCHTPFHVLVRPDHYLAELYPTGDAEIGEYLQRLNR